MSIETKSASGEVVRWSGGVAPRGMKTIDTMEIGNYEFGRTELMIDMLRFLSGDKSFMVGNVWVQIPERVDNKVKIGHLELPYDQFVEGVCWTLSQGGRFTQEFQIPLHAAVDIFAISALKEQLLGSVPNKNDRVLNIVKHYEIGYSAPEGIYGMANTR